MKKYFLCNLGFLLALIIFFGIFVENVRADAWWGEGYRSPEWVRANGGTTISYTIKGTSHDNKYKAMMFRNGEYVEVEFGNHATFDDAKNGTYTINFYRCKKSCKKQKFNNKTKIRDRDKKVASVIVVARSGEANILIFDASNNTVSLVNNRSRSSGLSEFEQQKRIAKKNEGQLCDYQQVVEEKNLFESLLFLSQKINSDLFFDVNVNMGIIPQFLVKN